MAERFLVVANQSLGGAALVSSVAAKVQRRAEVHIIVPATDPEHDLDSPPGASAQANAERRLAAELERCKAAGISATGEVGPTDPLEAIRQALQKSRYTGLIISTLPAGISRWVRMDLPHRAVREFRLPVEWVEARTDADEPTSVHIEVPPAARRALDRPNIPPQHTPPHR